MNAFEWIRLVLFVVLSAGILRLSWGWLRDPESYGFYRFFAFELLLGMVLLNLPAWFREAFSLHQLLSWVLLIASALLALHGFSLLRAIRRSDGQSSDRTGLITGGAYRWIRHPLYASLLYFAWGVFFKSISAWNAILALAISVALYLTAVHEESENLVKFGAPYRELMGRTQRFIPFIF